MRFLVQLYQIYFPEYLSVLNTHQFFFGQLRYEYTMNLTEIIYSLYLVQDELEVYLTMLPVAHLAVVW